MDDLVNSYILNKVPKMIYLNLPDFNAFNKEIKDPILQTTWRGIRHKSFATIPLILTYSFLFFTLFWLIYYPTIKLLFALFHLHTQTYKLDSTHTRFKPTF